MPIGPVCDFASNAGCSNCEEACEELGCGVSETCDPSTDCKCSDCRDDGGCSGGEKRIDRECTGRYKTFNNYLLYNLQVGMPTH